jgi:short-subunit dehydrogenase
LGKAFVIECAARGWDLFLTDRYQYKLDTLAACVRNSYDITVYSKPCDLAETDSRNLFIDYLNTLGYHFKMLINVAGVDHEGRFMDQSASQIQSILRLNIESTVSLTHAILPLRHPLEPFHLINVASLAAFYPMPIKAVYAASKRFLVDFSLALREELRSAGVTVTVLCPAGMPTNLECIKAIEGQGLAGQITTMDIGRVAYQTVNAALAGKAVIIPGRINSVLQFLGALIPPTLIARQIGIRWDSVRKRRVQHGTLSVA